MITLKIEGSVTVEHATSEEEATEVLLHLIDHVEVDSVTRGGPDASPVYLIKISGFVEGLGDEEIEAGPPVREEPSQEAEAGGKAEFEEVKD